MVRYLFMFGDESLRCLRSLLWADCAGMLETLPGGGCVTAVQIGLRDIRQTDARLEETYRLYSEFGSPAALGDSRVSLVTVNPVSDGGTADLSAPAHSDEELLYRALFGQEKADPAALTETHSEAAEAVLYSRLGNDKDSSLAAVGEKIRAFADGEGVQVLLCGSGSEGFSAAGVKVMAEKLAAVKENSTYLKLGVLLALPGAEADGGDSRNCTDSLLRTMADLAETGKVDTVSLFGCQGWNGQGTQPDFSDLPLTALMLDFYSRVEIPRETETRYVHLDDSMYGWRMFGGMEKRCAVGYNALMKTALLYRYEMLPFIRERLNAPSLIKDRQRGYYHACFAAMRKAEENERDEMLSAAERMDRFLDLYAEDIGKVISSVPAFLTGWEARSQATEEAARNLRALLDCVGELSAMEKEIGANDLADVRFVSRSKGQDSAVDQLLHHAEEKRKELAAFADRREKLVPVIGGLGQMMLTDRMLSGVERALKLEQAEAARREQQIRAAEAADCSSLSEMQTRRNALHRLHLHMQKLQAQQAYLQKEKEQAEQKHLWLVPPKGKVPCDMTPSPEAAEQLNRHAGEMRKTAELYAAIDGAASGCASCKQVLKQWEAAPKVGDNTHPLHYLTQRTFKAFEEEWSS